MQYKCSSCDKYFNSKKKRNDHQRRVHPATERKTTPATLKLKVPSEKGKAAPPQEYHCVDCGGPVTKGQKTCPGCGVRLDWGLL